MQTDPASLDPEERTNKFLALISAALGDIGIPGGLLPACGAVVGALGIISKNFGMRSEHRRRAILGIALSIIGLLTAVLYGLLTAAGFGI